MLINNKYVFDIDLKYSQSFPTILKTEISNLRNFFINL